MNAQRRSEAEHLIDDIQNMIVECNLQMEKGTAKYASAEAWLQAGGALSDKLSDLLTETQGAAVRDSETSAKETRDHDDLLESSENLETALNDVNLAVDALGNEDYKDAREKLEKTVHALRKAMG